MTDFLTEKVFRMPPRSRALIERYAETFLQTYTPEHLLGAEPLDLLGLVEHELEEAGIYFAPATNQELGARLAATDPRSSEAGGEINVLMNESLWYQLLDGGRRANRARATVAHELGHVVLHVPVVRNRLRIKNAATLDRVSRGAIPAYECPEWQAWTFAGFILMPRSALATFDGAPIGEVAERFGVSTAMLKSHARKVRAQTDGGVLTM